MKQNNFKIIVLVTFSVFAVIGVLLFAGIGGLSKGTPIRPVVIWGTVESGVMNELLKQMGLELKEFARVSYAQKDPRTYEQEFIEALASSTGPDILLLSQDLLVAHRNKIFALPYDNFNERLFKDTFIEEGELFTDESGVIGMPFLIDPLVLYWNRTVFSNKGIAKPPVYWEELFTLAPKLIERDNASNIAKSAIAFGEYTNIDHAKEILSALIIQADSTITAYNIQGDLQSVLGDRGEYPVPPSEAALRYYTEFSNPVQNVYSWNRSLPHSKQMFIAGDLAMYIGFASEFTELRRLNPNLNFDVALLPQSKGVEEKSTYGDLTAMVVMRTSPYLNAAFQTVITLSEKKAGEVVSAELLLPSVRRDLLSVTDTDAYTSVFNRSALFARGWLDPDRDATDVIFKTMVEDVTSGRFRLQQAVQNAHKELSRVSK